MPSFCNHSILPPLHTNRSRAITRPTRPRTQNPFSLTSSPVTDQPFPAASTTAAGAGEEEMPLHSITFNHAHLLHPSSPFHISGGATPRVSKLRSSLSPSPAASNSYLDMWKKAVDRDRNSTSFLKISDAETKEAVDRKTEHFNKIICVPKEERDRVQRLQVIDRASAAIAAARALVGVSIPKPLLEDQHGKMAGGNGIVVMELVKQGVLVPNIK